MNSFSEIIDAFGTAAEFARAIGISHEAARKMRQRDQIAVSHWARLVSAARERNIQGVNTDLLMALANKSEVA